MSKKEERAYKRLIFYFTSRVLFMIIAIILISSWCSMFVHADSGSTLMSIYNIDSNKLNPDYTPTYNANNRAFFNSNDYLWAVANIPELHDALGSVDPTNFHPPYNWNEQIVAQDFSACDPDNNFIIACQFYFSGIGNMIGYIEVPKDIFLNGQACFYRGGYIHSTVDFDYTVKSTWQELTTRTFDHTQGDQIIQLQQALNTSNCYFCSCPYWDGQGFVGSASDCIADILNNNNDPFYYNNSLMLFNSNYFMYNDISNMSDSFVPDVPQESNLNHLVLDDIQIGLTSNGRNTELYSSSVVVGCSVDDWIENNPDQFYMQIVYTIDFEAKWDGNDTPLNGSYSTRQTLPIKTFLNDAYSYGVSRIASDSNFDYGALKNTYSSTVLSEDSYQGLFPTIKNTVTKYVTDTFNINNAVPVGHIFVINKFDLTVKCNLFDFSHQGGNMSGDYIKVFDFLTGSASVTSAKILQNQNPWTGESDPQVSPLVPQAGGGLSNNGYSSGGSSVNVQINDYGKVPINANTPEQIQAVKERYTSLTEYFNDYFYNLSQTQSNNNFLYFIGQTLPQIPGINFMIECAMLIFALAVILFVLKVLLF